MGDGSIGRSARLVSEGVLKIVGMGRRVDFFNPLGYVLISPTDTRPPENECHRSASRAVIAYARVGSRRIVVSAVGL